MVGDDDLLLGGTFCEEAGAALTTQTALPGVPTTWSINTSTPEAGVGTWSLFPLSLFCCCMQLVCKCRL